MKIETERLILREMRLGDKSEVFAYRKDKIANIFQNWIPNTIQEVESFIHKNSDRPDIPESWYQLVIIEKVSNNVIGDIGLHFTGDANKQVELGCTLSKNSQQKGYAAESLTCVIDTLFKVFGKHRVFTSIDPRNKSSIRLVERIGMRKEAHFIESLWINNEWVDDLVYAILAREWRK